MTDFFVAPDGDDTSPGTEQHPFATLECARQAARESDGPATVHLRSGTHLLAQPLTLTADDSGPGGHPVVYQAYGFGTDDQEHVVVSGGSTIRDWQERDGVWIADVAELDTRQLYVDGRRVERAGVDGLPEGTGATATGYAMASTAPMDWRAASSVEFVYRGVYPWTEARCAVAAVARDGDTTVVTMARPAFERATELYNYNWGYDALAGPGLPTRVENDPSFLTEPGTFVLDRSRPGRHRLHYLPRPGEDPRRTSVVAPALETLLHAKGTRDIAFRGLEFADATWLGPNRDGGFLHYHGNGHYLGGPVQRLDMGEGQWLTIPTDTATIPACVSLHDTTDVRFERCVFTRLGGTALSATGGRGTSVRGCDFTDVAASAIQCTGTEAALIEDNRIERVGLDFAGSPGVSITDTTDCTVANNHVAHVPHCGIVAGPGRGTRILRNRTTATMEVLADGGGVYLSGPQGDSHGNGAVISANVIEDTQTPYNFGLYTDYGAAWVTVEGNVVTRADNTAILTVAPPLDHVVYRGNVWDADPVGSDDVPAGVTFEGNTTIKDQEALHAATRDLQHRAGLLRER
jgi:hypothetical protein